MHKDTESRTEAPLLVLDRCDAVLRVGGPSAGADEMVSRAREAGKPVAFAVGELP